jgi:hypothetical protein
MDRPQPVNERTKLIAGNLPLIAVNSVPIQMLGANRDEWTTMMLLDEKGISLQSPGL